MFQILNSNDIKIKRSQMDCGSFTKALIKVVEENSELLYIRAQLCADLTANIKVVKQWKKVTIGSKEFEVASVFYKPFGVEKIENIFCIYFGREHYAHASSLKINNQVRFTIKLIDFFIYHILANS